VPDSVALEPGTTGRSLLVLDANARTTMAAALENVAGVAAGQPTQILERLGVAIVPAPPHELTGAASFSGLRIEPEYYKHTDESSMEYLRGYRDGVVHLVDGLTASRPTAAAAPTGTSLVDEDEVTWALRLTRVADSPCSGAGIAIAILDTGIDVTHPDFHGRESVSRSFVDGEEVQDGHGHGTHCIGSVAGPIREEGRRRHGVAYESRICAGKVLSNAGVGRDGDILAGLEWALTNGAHIVSMSLSSRPIAGQPYSQAYEQAAQRALAGGTLIVAAAGNTSVRQSNVIEPVQSPANCPSIMSVAAVDRRLLIASFSCGAANQHGGEVDIAAPGVAVYSSWPGALLHKELNGTSMATPLVAGIAALHAQVDPALRGRALWDQLLRTARRLNLPEQDVGRGLVQAPVR
jgi:subtilisin family serine protease